MKQHERAGRTVIRSILLVYEARGRDPDFPVCMKAVFRGEGEREDLVVKVTEDGLAEPCNGDRRTTWVAQMQRIAELAAAEEWGEDYGTPLAPSAPAHAGTMVPALTPRRPWWKRLLRWS